MWSQNGFWLIKAIYHVKTCISIYIVYNFYLGFLKEVKANFSHYFGTNVYFGYEFFLPGSASKNLNILNPKLSLVLGK